MKKRKLVGIASFVILLALWLYASYAVNVNELFLPKFHKVVIACITLFKDDGFIKDIGISVYRVVGGFAAAAVLAVPLGLLMGVSEKAADFFAPVISFIRYMPASAFIPMFIIWFGLGEIEKMAVIFYGSFFYLTLMVMDVAKNIDHALIEVSRTLGASKSKIFYKVTLRAALPGIVDALRTTFGAAWTYLIVAEIVGASSGIGYSIQNGSRFLRTDKMFVGILTIGVLGLISDKLFEFISKRAFSYLKKG